MGVLVKTVKRYGCPHCRRWRSSEPRTQSHMARCWKNPDARSCGSCVNHLPPTKGENAEWNTGYPGSPPEPRSCDADIDNNTYGMPRDCPSWEPDEAGRQSLSQAEGTGDGRV